MNKTKSWFFEKYQNIYKSLSKPNMNWRKDIQINKIKNEKGI